MIFWKILLAHVLTDFVLQPDHIAENKGNVKILFLHGFIFFFLSALILLPSFSLQTTMALFSLALFHALVDYLKAILGKRVKKNLWLSFLGDQALHVFGIGVGRAST